MRSGDWLSGEYLSSILGVSRVAVWKHLNKMKEAGYPVESSGSGYRLDPREDTLTPWALSAGDREVHHFRETGSTMDEARLLAESGVDDGALVLAEEQTKGRDRLGKKWDSKIGGLYFTIIEYPQAPLVFVHKMNKIAVLAVWDTLRQKFGIDTWCEEPNNVVTSEGKIAGILLEVSGEIERIRYVNIGIGINLTAIKTMKTGVKRRTVLESFLPIYESCENMSEEDIRVKWSSCLKKNPQTGYEDKKQ